MTESSELKPCPFCGGKAELEDHRLVWMVCCTECNAIFRGERADEPDTEEDANDIDWNYYERTAIDGWNTRHADSPEIDQLRARVAELLAALRALHQPHSRGCYDGHKFAANRLRDAADRIRKEELK